MQIPYIRNIDEKIHFATGQYTCPDPVTPEDLELAFLKGKDLAPWRVGLTKDGKLRIGAWTSNHVMSIDDVNNCHRPRRYDTIEGRATYRAGGGK